MKLKAFRKGIVILSAAKDLFLRFFGLCPQNDASLISLGKTLGIFFLLCLANIPLGFSLTAVEDSAEDVYWAKPMTTHDYKKKSDLHSIVVSAMAITELEFTRLGDGLIDLTTKNKKSPISKSLDSLEYAYSKLPRIKPVQRFGQLWDALQLRQLSLSDARIITAILFADAYGGVTPIMQVRANKLLVFVEDIINDVDSALMFPINWSVSSLRDKPTKVKSLGYVADGMGAIRWRAFSALKYVNRKIVRFGSDVVLGIEKTHDFLIRRKRKKLHGQKPIYAKMPFSVFQENRDYFNVKEGAVSAGTVADWYGQIFYNPDLLPEDIQATDFRSEKIITTQDFSREVIVEAEYDVWDETPQALRKYVITPDEFTELIQKYNPTFFSNES